MLICRQPDEVRAWTRARRSEGRRIVAVPTMGALHAGHLALVEEARRNGDLVVVTIFVNPLQFNVRDDFDTYPRPIDDDLEACRAAGVDAVYAPTAATMYPPGFQTHVEPGVLADSLEGAGRPGHFRGVTTVVAKLFGAVEPDVAIFGQKDFQQLAVVRRMVVDLDMGVTIVAVPTVREPDVAIFGQKDFQQLAIVRRMVVDLDIGVTIVGVPTVRESDGLAISSRNQRLAAPDRRAAVCLIEALRIVEDAVSSGEHDTSRLESLARDRVAAEPRADLEYVRIVDPETLVAVDVVEEPAVVLIAARFGDVRLIDNLLVTP